MRDEYLRRKALFIDRMDEEGIQKPDEYKSYDDWFRAVNRLDHYIKKELEGGR